MKFIPKDLNESTNVNISQRTPLKELAVVLGSVCLLTIVVYIVSGFAVQLLLAKYEKEVTNTLGMFLKTGLVTAPEYKDERVRVQKIVDQLVTKLPDSSEKYTVYIDPSPDINALAYPGQNIVVYAGLLKSVETENELAMVLAHELGHFAHKHHLRGIGRGLVLFFLSATVFGQSSVVTDVVGNSLELVSAHYSREQETEADYFGLQLLHSTYGHVGGATDFFKRLMKKENSTFAKLFSNSHPLSKDRIENIKRWSAERGYLSKTTKKIRFNIQ